MIKKLLVICGPTATGKTDLAIKLAKKFNGELVSADSRQVYKYMDIGIGKDLPQFSHFSKENLREIPGIERPKFRVLNSRKARTRKFSFGDKFRIGYYLVEDTKIWLYDIVEPDYQFTVADYVKCANLVIEDIWQRRKLPILVGGTGFYIKAVIDGIETLGVPPDWELREKLENKKIEELKDLLKKLDPLKWNKMNESDRKNSRRLIRAIEIAYSKLARSVSTYQYMETKTINQRSQNPKLKDLVKDLKLNTLFIGLTASYKILYQRIDQRVEERVRQGVENEIEKLLKMGYSWENSVLGTTIGYKEWKPYFEKKSTLQEAIQKWKFAEHGYARRQMTWFKKDERVNWFNILEPSFKEDVEKMISKWYNQTQDDDSN